MDKEILLIDDDAITNFLNQDLIEYKFPGRAITVFYNGADALTYILDHREREFIIFLDLNMPVMSGWEFLEVLESKMDTRSLEIHVLTSSINPRDRANAKKNRMVTSFMEKPLDESLLDDLLIETIKKGDCNR
ncbi:MAG: response regulator [Muricauda sp.]|nr:response regulator [Allomuricauda sp.]MBO6532176.1 response regulator [Allomuricauda sp.]MBO6588526.1 response regulator [Allomuricauda sp.]MBO6618334.1 response regulator [Allomuricauda sp.]MBO6644064.1 response regulator [Allomuricauda sp.]MBO6746948.1 response regulator [Allomuricauda sp.]